MAVARNGGGLFQSHFVSLSSSAEVVRRFGYDVLKFPSHGQSGGLSQVEWNDRFAEFFDSVCRANSPAAIVFDGTWVYRGIHEAAKRHGIKLVWLRRGLWMDGATTLQIRDRASIVNHLLVPRDIADGADTGPVAVMEGTIVPAPTLTWPSEVLDRSDALRAIGLNPDRKYVLVQLGSGTVNDIVDLRERIIQQILLSESDTDIVIGLSPLSGHLEDNRRRVHVVREYPLARLLRGFEFMVTAAGYNSIHESVRFCIPALVVPNLSTLADNQPLRASEFERLGFGLTATTDTEIRLAVDRMLDTDERETFRRHLATARFAIDSGEGAAKALHLWLTNS
jgi:UDP:flavonoid glycosyltransferase YjiC (YdhE family)